MKNIKIFVCIVVIMSASAFTALKSVSWKVKDDYSVKSTHGVFRGLKATIIFDEEKPERSVITAQIDARTINSGNGALNAHAKEREALFTEKYPWITFVSTAVRKAATGYEAKGNLTLKGVTKEITIPFVFDSKKATDKFPFISKETFSGRITIVPKDFNITREGTPGEEVISLTIPVTQ